jgi:xanthine/uracil/vitamin C permease (AzgA family)
MGNKSKVAVLALVGGIACFLNLLGIEKAAFAITAGWMALKEIDLEGKTGKNFAYAGIILGFLYIVVITLLLIFKGPEFISIIQSLKGK